MICAFALNSHNIDKCYTKRKDKTTKARISSRIRAFNVSGAAGSRTLVQTKYFRTFYMFRMQLNFRVKGRLANIPIFNLISLISDRSQSQLLTYPESCYVRDDVYQKSTKGHKGC